MGSGITHHAVEDFGLMSLMPNMTVVAPGDPEELRMLLPQMFQLKGPSYLRIGAFGILDCQFHDCRKLYQVPVGHVREVRHPLPDLLEHLPRSFDVREVSPQDSDRVHVFSVTCLSSGNAGHVMA